MQAAKPSPFRKAACLVIAADRLVKLPLVLLQSLVLLVFRLYWGWEFFQTGKGKLFNHENVVSFFSELGIPFPALNAWFVGGLECVGGLLLMIGLFSRPVAFLLSGNMLVAYLSVADDRATLFGIFQDPDAFLAADPYFYLQVSVLVLAFGAGMFSLDYLIRRRWHQ